MKYMLEVDDYKKKKEASFPLFPLLGTDEAQDTGGNGLLGAIPTQVAIDICATLLGS